MPKKDQQGYYGFDPSGLERAAQAAKYLDQSPNAKQAFDLALKKEETKQLELQENTKKMEMQRIQVQEEERRKTVQYEVEMAKRRAEYQVQLELQRDQEKLQQKEQMREMRRHRDEESTAKQEQIRRQTLEYEYQLKQAEIQQKAQMEQDHLNQKLQMENQAQGQRLQMKAAMAQDKLREEQKVAEQLGQKNRDFMQNMLSQAERERRETQKQLLLEKRQNVANMFNMLSTSVTGALQNPKLLARAAYFFILCFGAYHLTRLVVAVSTGLLLARLGKPQLVRETSKLHTSNPLFVPFMFAKKFTQQKMKRTEKDLLDGVILEKNLEDQLREISYAVLNRKKHFAPTKNLMFYGPPGTGKTLFAKKLAMKSGLEYAVMVGSDIAPLGPLAVRELNNLFDWAEKQKNGMILFIDEADAFLRNRKHSDMSEFMRHTINSFLYRTGSPSDRVIVVLATNSPDQLDEAVHDRIDEIVGFGLPSVNERRIMLFHYLVKYCQPPVTTTEKLKFYYNHPRAIYTGKKLIRMEGVTTEFVQKIAEETEGFSGRELMKMVVAWHDAAFTLPEPILTPELMLKILHKFHLQHKLKKTWSKDQGMMLEKMLFLEEELEKDSEEKQHLKEEMQKEAEELRKQIDEERIKIKEMRQQQQNV